MNEIQSNSLTWPCLKCGEENNFSESFCRKCGSEKGSEQTITQKKSGIIKIMVAVILVMLLLGGGFFGFQYFKKRAEEKAAGEFLIKQQEAFGNAIKSVNEINSEKDLGAEVDKEDNKDIAIKKIEEEKTKAEKASAAVKSSQLISSQDKENKLTAGLATLLENFYSRLDTAVIKYNGFVAFELEENKVEVEYEKMNEKFKSEFKSTNADSVVKLIAFFKSRRELEQKFVEMVKALNPPAGLTEYVSKYAELQEEYIAILAQIGEALEKNDLKIADEADKKYADFESNYSGRIKKINEIREYYYSQMHDEFVSIRGQADKIKTEFTITDSKFGIAPADVVIEGW